MPFQLLLFGANLLPLAGVLFWGWDAFVLMILYWCETAVIAFWTIVHLTSRAAIAESGMRFEGGKGPPNPIGLALFLTVHAGVFMGVHLSFLWALFAGTWAQQIDGPWTFFTRLIVGTGLWAPLAVLFIARGAQEIYDRLVRRLSPGTPPPIDGGSALLGLYARIFVMQFTIIVGGFFASLTHSSVFALTLLIGLKTAIDLGFDRALGLAKARSEAADTKVE